jgi:hypothetical protein
MHRLDDSLRALAAAILETSLERLAADPPELGTVLPPEAVATRAGVTITEEGLGPDAALARFRDVLLPLTTAIDHPRYMAFIPSAPTAAAALFDALVSATSIYAGTWLEGAGAVHAENEALRWLADLAGMPAEAGAFFRDVADHAIRVHEQVESLDTLLSSAHDAHMARISVQQNDDMRKISAWVAIAAVPTAIAGIYGMNFQHMPELQWRFGYPLAIAIMAVFCVTLYRLFKKSGWL